MDGTRDREGWRGKGALVGQRIGGELIGATMSEVEPGNKLWPFHTHYLDDIDAVVASLHALGADLVGEVENYEDIYRLCYVRGPEGIIVELAERIG